MNWISPTGLSPCAAMPTQSPPMRIRRAAYRTRAPIRTLLQSIGCAEDAAVDPDILAEHDDIGVILHRAVDGHPL